MKSQKKVATALLKAIQESCADTASFTSTGFLEIKPGTTLRVLSDIGKSVVAFGYCSTCLKNRTIGHLMCAASTVRGGQAALLRMVYGESWESHESTWYQCYRVWKLVPEADWDICLPWEHYMTKYDKKQRASDRPIHLKMLGGSVVGTVWRIRLEYNGRGAYMDVPLEDLPSLFESGATQ